MAEDACLVCFRSGQCDLDGAAKALAGFNLTVTRRDDELLVAYDDGPTLRVSYAVGDYVAEEAAEIARSDPKALATLPCDARFEIAIDDLDAVLNEYSTLFAVQEALAGATGGFVFDSWNGNILWM